MVESSSWEVPKECLDMVLGALVWLTRWGSVTDMGVLVLEVLTQLNHLPIGRVQITKLSQLSPSHPIKGSFPLVSPTSDKLGELQVSLVLEPLPEVYDTCTTTEGTLDLAQRSSKSQLLAPSQEPRHTQVAVTHPESVENSRVTSLRGKDHLLFQENSENIKDTFPASYQPGIFPDEPLKVNPSNPSLLFPTSTNPGMNMLSMHNPTTKDLLSALLDQGRKLRDAMFVSAMKSSPDMETELNKVAPFLEREDFKAPTKSPKVLKSSFVPPPEYSHQFGSELPKQQFDLNSEERAIQLLLGSADFSSGHLWDHTGSLWDSLSHESEVYDSELGDPHYDQSLLERLFYTIPKSDSSVSDSLSEGDVKSSEKTSKTETLRKANAANPQKDFNTLDQNVTEIRPSCSPTAPPEDNREAAYVTSLDSDRLALLQQIHLARVIIENLKIPPKSIQISQRKKDLMGKPPRPASVNKCTFFVECHFPVGVSKDDKGQVSIKTELIRVASSKITDDEKEEQVNKHIPTFQLKANILSAIALENKEQFTLALVLINYAKLNSCVCNRAILRGKFIYIQPVAIGSAVLQLCRVIQAKLLSVSWEIPVEKEGDHPQVGPLTVFDMKVMPFPLTSKRLERLKDNVMIIEAWNKLGSPGRDRLLGLVKLPLHQFYISFKDPKISHLLLQAQYPVVAVDSYMPVVDVFTGSTSGSLRVILAMGSADQQADPEGKDLMEHMFEIHVESVKGLTPLQSTVWGEADCYIQYHFPVQEAGCAALQGPGFREDDIKLKPFRTATTLCVPDPIFNDEHHHSLVVSADVPVQRFLVSAFMAPGVAGGGIQFEVWCRYYYPNVREQLVAKGTLPLSRLCAMVTMQHREEIGIQTFNLPLIPWTDSSEEFHPQSSEFEHHIEFLCNLIIQKGSGESSSLGELLQSGNVIFSIYHQSTKSATDRLADRASRDYLLGTVTIPTRDLLTRRSGISGWFPVTLSDDLMLPHCTNITQAVVGGLELSVTFAHQGDREHVLEAAKLLGWSSEEIHGDSTEESEDWEQSANTVTVTVSTPRLWLPLHCVLLTGQTHLNESTFCYLRYKLYNQKATWTWLRRPKLSSNAEHVTVNFKKPNKVTLRRSQGLLWFFREVKLEIQVWWAFGKEDEVERPLDTDRLIGSAYVDLAVLAERSRRTLSVSGVYPLFRCNAADLAGAAVRVHVSLAPTPAALPSRIPCAQECSSSEDAGTGKTPDLSQQVPENQRLNIVSPGITNGKPQEENVMFLENTVAVNILVERAKCLSLKGSPLTEQEVTAPSSCVSFAVAGADAPITTPVIGNTDSPVWNFQEQARLSKELLLDPQQTLVFKVWHKAETERVIGFASVDLSPLLFGFQLICGWYNIADFSGQCRGQIKVSISPLQNINNLKEERQSRARTQLESSFEKASFPPFLGNAANISKQILNSLSKEVSVPTQERKNLNELDEVQRYFSRKLTRSFHDFSYGNTSKPSHEEQERNHQGSMSREVDLKGCHLLEKSSQLVSQVSSLINDLQTITKNSKEASNVHPDSSRKLDAVNVSSWKEEGARPEVHQGWLELDPHRISSDPQQACYFGRRVFERHMLHKLLDPIVAEDEHPMDYIQEDEGAFAIQAHSEEEYEEDVIEPRTLNEITLTDRTSPWSSVISETGQGTEQHSVDSRPGDQHSMDVDCFQRENSSTLSSILQGDKESELTTLSPFMSPHTGGSGNSLWEPIDGFQSFSSGTKTAEKEPLQPAGQNFWERTFNCELRKKNVEFHVGSEELLPFPGDMGLTNPKTTGREDAKNTEDVNEEHREKERSDSDENFVRTVAAQAGSERNSESFPNDSSEDPLEGSENSIKPKITVYPSLLFLKHSLHSSRSFFNVQGCIVCAHQDEMREFAAGEAFLDSPSATMVGLKPPEVPPTAAMKFVSAGMAGCIADLCTFPLDTAKVRLQIQGEAKIPRAISSMEYRGVLGTLSTMVRTEGPRSLYCGLVAGLQRQMSFASIRIGLYDSVKQLYTTKGAENTGLAARLLAGCTTGAVAVACAQPTDVVKVRFQASGALLDGARRYSSTVDAYRTIAREEGVRGLWRGMLPNIARNAIINCGELVTYDLLKDALLQTQLMGDNVPCHFVAAFGAGFCATVVASPVDVVKTRYMNASPRQYRNALSCLLALLMQDGLVGLYKGFVPSFLRLGSWNVVMFVSYEQLQRAVVLARPVLA
ncbi:hypothetical protein WISP_19115 [Willisornis vidua]|uniref:C2 domain-containing protein n=1 Tax=Willisornis vidua TaxID=1566151 RepID=A0ABQ9DP29_9PASS|nr:hypothetical protein WISP_19115 [Willisornis vidua]